MSSKVEKGNCVSTAHSCLALFDVPMSSVRGSRSNYIQVSCLSALLQLTRCLVALGGCVSRKTTWHPAVCIQRKAAWWDGARKQLKSVSPLLHPVLDINDLGGFKMCHSHFTRSWEAWIVVTAMQVDLFFFPRQLNGCLKPESSLLKWLTLLYCFATNQGHCMLIKFTVARLNCINAHAYNQY